MPKSEIKSRPQRIELDYFRRPDPLQRLRWLLATGVLVVVGSYAAYVVFWGWPTHVNTGPLSSAHAHLEQTCYECHDRRWSISLASDALRIAAEKTLQHIESTCQRCHQVANHYRDSLDARHTAIDRDCVGCHREHLGREHQLTLVHDASCTQCHRDLAARLRPSVSTDLRSNIERFSSESHGDFRSLATDAGRVRFNHALHLQPGQVQPGARNAVRLEMLPERWQHAYQKPGQNLDDLVILDCRDCHQLPSRVMSGHPISESTWTESAASDRNHLPIQYQQHCAGCHALNYADQTPDSLPLPHAAPWQEVRTLLAAKVQGARLLGVEHEADPASADKPLSGEILQRRPRDPTMAEKDALQRALLLVREQCLQCHRPEDITDASIRTLTSRRDRSLIPSRWLQRGSFHHGRHLKMDCQFCHDVAAAPRLSQPDHETVMIKGIESCTPCHRSDAKTAPPDLASLEQAAGGLATWASDRCTLCHRYHWTRPAIQEWVAEGGVDIGTP